MTSADLQRQELETVAVMTEHINNFPIITKYNSQYNTHLHDKIGSDIQQSAFRDALNSLFRVLT